MSVKYTIVESRDAFRPTEYAARVEIGPPADIATLSTWIAGTDCGLDETQIATVLERLPAACLAVLLEGHPIQFDGLFNLVPVIDENIAEGVLPGTFTSQQLDVRGTAAWKMREEFKAQVVPERVRSVPPGPVPLGYLDFKTGTRNELLTPGGFGSLRGLGLRINPERDDEGVFLISESGETARVETIRNNQSREIAFVNPAPLPAGNYRLEVRARANSGGNLHAGRLGTLVSV